MSATFPPATNPRSAARPNDWRRGFGFFRTNWVVSAAVLGLLPKCALCLFAYAAAGAGLAKAGSELCGTAEIDAGFAQWSWVASIAGALAVLYLGSRLHREKRLRRETAARPDG